MDGFTSNDHRASYRLVERLDTWQAAFPEPWAVTGDDLSAWLAAIERKPGCSRCAGIRCSSSSSTGSWNADAPAPSGRDSGTG